MAMRTLTRTAPLVCGIVLLAALTSAQQPATSIATLREQICKLEVIDRDPDTPPEVKSLNSGFLAERRAQLRELLAQRIAALHKYHAAVQSALSPSELQAVESSIHKLEVDLQALTDGRPLVTLAATEAAPAPTPVTPAQPARIEKANFADAAPQPAPAVVERPATVRENSLPEVSPSAAAPAPAPAATPDTQKNFNDWMNARIRSIVEARMAQRSNTAQTETTSMNENSTTLVDQSSASDLIGAGLNLAGLSTSASSKREANSVSVTTSAYALYAAANNVDPLNPGFYNRHRAWRKLWFTLGYDDEKSKDGSTVDRTAKTFGVKWLVKNYRDPSRAQYSDDFAALTDSLANASNAFGDYFDRLLGAIFKNEKARKIILQDFKTYLLSQKDVVAAGTDPQLSSVTAADIDELVSAVDQNKGDTLFVFDKSDTIVFPPAATRAARVLQLRYVAKFQNDNFTSVDAFNKKFGTEIVEEFERFLEKDMDEKNAFVQLAVANRALLQKIRRAPQFSLEFLTKQRPATGLDDYMGKLIFDWGVYNRVNLTLNGDYMYMNSQKVGGDLRAGRIAGQLQFQLNQEPGSLVGRKPIFFYVGGDAGVRDGTKPTYHVQSKISFSIADGIDFPISVTYASQRSLIEEKKVRGQFGFTIDTSRLLKAVTSGLPLFQ